MAGLERFELPTAGFEDQNSSTELQAELVWVVGFEPTTSIFQRSPSTQIDITPRLKDCSLASSGLSLVFTHTEPDFLMRRFSRTCRLGYLTRRYHYSYHPSGWWGVEPPSVLQCIKFRTSQHCAFLLPTLQTWCLFVGTIHGPSPYQDDALPLS